VTLLNFRAENHPQQVAARGPRDDVDDRRTPPELFDPLHAEFRFTVDVACSTENAKLPKHFDYQADGLAQSWRGERVWCNPPFSYIPRWVDKAWHEMQLGCELIVMLVPANRCEQGWWQRNVEPFRDGRADHTGNRAGIRLTTRFIRGRTRFTRPDWIVPQKGDRPPFGCCLLTWDKSVSQLSERSPNEGQT
jgi:phage N-6-adenine-methyltransferase